MRNSERNPRSEPYMGIPYMVATWGNADCLKSRLVMRQAIQLNSILELLGEGIVPNSL